MERLVLAGIVLIVVGILLVIAGIASTALRGARAGDANVEAGGIVFIGPIPIIFGTSKSITKAMLILALALTLLLLLLHLLANRSPRPPPG